MYCVGRPLAWGLAEPLLTFCQNKTNVTALGFGLAVSVDSRGGGSLGRAEALLHRDDINCR